MQTLGKGDRKYLDEISHFNSYVSGQLTSFIASEFDRLFQSSAEFLNRSVNHCNKLRTEEQAVRETLKQSLLPHTMLYMFFYFWVVVQKEAMELRGWHFYLAFS